jgi:hypothetical protein
MPCFPERRVYFDSDTEAPWSRYWRPICGSNILLTVPRNEWCIQFPFLAAPNDFLCPPASGPVACGEVSKGTLAVRLVESVRTTVTLCG